MDNRPASWARPRLRFLPARWRPRRGGCRLPQSWRLEVRLQPKFSGGILQWKIAGQALADEVEEHRIEGVTVKVYSPAKTTRF
jgi:hypothetical protein